MRNVAITMMLAATLAGGQTKKPAAKPHAKSLGAQKSTPHRETAAGLPSMATAKSFLEHMFGWNPDMNVQVKEIKPSAAPGIAEIVVHAKTPRGEGDSSIFVTPDEKHAIAGQMLPFSGRPGEPPSNDEVDGFMRQMTQGNPGITWTVAQVKQHDLDDLTAILVILQNPQGQRGGQTFWVTRDGLHAIVGDPGPFGADPFAPARAELSGQLNGPWKGSASPKITMVEFGDLECPSCKAAAPVVERLVKEVPGSKLVFQQFPLTSIHHWAMRAAEFGDCIAQKDNNAFWKFSDAVFAAQEDISSHVETADPTKKPNLAYAEQKLTELAGQAGLNEKQIAECAESPRAKERVEHSIDLGKKMNVTGTPTLFVNGRRIMDVSGMPFEQLKRMVEFSGTPEGK